MNREEFLKNKEKVTNILEENEILYELIFDYRYKTEFDNIKILINDFIDDKYLSSLFGSLESVKGNMLKIKFENIDLIFIKSNNNYWVNSFYYYSGEIVSIALNKIANQLGLEYNEYGLFYIHNVKKPILLTNKVFEIFNFFEVNTNSIIEGFDYLKNVYEFIINSTFFNAKIFTSNDVNQNSLLYEENLKNYNKFIDAIEIFKNNSNCNYEFDIPENNIDLIDEYFPEVNLLMYYAKQNIIK